MRRKWNDAFDDIALISDTEADGMVIAPEGYLKLIATDIAKRLP